MGHKVFWYIPQRVFAVQVVGTIDVGELKQISEEVASFVHSGQSPVHGIMDMRQLGGFPHSLQDVRGAVNMLQEDGLEWVILISTDPMLKFMANIMTQLLSKKHKAFRQPDDATAFLAEQDSTLLPPPTFPEMVKTD